MRSAIVGIICGAMTLPPCSAQSVQQQVLAAAQTTVSAPTFLSANSNVCSFSAGSCTLSTINVPANSIVLFAVGVRAALATCTGFTFSTTGTNTVTQIASNSSTTNACIVTELIANPTASATYAITVTGGVAAVLYSTQVFSKGILSVLLDTTCTGTASATSVTCSAAMTPGASTEIIAAFSYAFDGNGTASDNSTPGMTVSSQHQTVGTGSSISQYLIGNPTSGTYKPGISGVGAGDPIVLTGVIIK